MSNGRVTFTVANEFKVTLTLFGVETSLPWRLLDIQFLIEDEGVSEGRALVHELQKNYLIAMIQNKLNSKVQVKAPNLLDSFLYVLGVIEM